MAKYLVFCSELMSAPVRRIDEIFSLPYSADDFKGQDIPPSDDESWMYNGEAELNTALMERQKEMQLYSSKNKKKQKLIEQETGPSSGSNNDDFDPSDIAKNMCAFIHKISSYKGAEVPADRLVWYIAIMSIYFSCYTFQNKIILSST